MNKVAIITGASKGIGLATAKRLADCGYTVYGFARNSFSENNIISICADISDFESVKSAVERIIEKEKRLDLLINNAGMGISGSVENTSIEDAEYIFKVNLFGAFHMIKLCLPYLRETQGRIINLSSVAASLCIPFQAFYSSTKAALEALAYALIPEVKPFKVKISNVLPGDTKTNFTQARRKNYSLDDSVYGKKTERSVSMMEKDEQNGMSPDCVAKAVMKTLKRKCPPVSVTVGFKYKLFMFLNKILPKKFVIFIIGKLYG